MIVLRPSLPPASCTTTRICLELSRAADAITRSASLPSMTSEGATAPTAPNVSAPFKNSDREWAMIAPLLCFSSLIQLVFGRGEHQLQQAAHSSLDDVRRQVGTEI